MNDTTDLPAVGRLTFDVEGQEGGPFHSRCLHVPSQSSGLTLGRGYDMKERTKAEVRDDLVSAGVAAATANLISQAAGMSGDRAEQFIAENDLEDFEITPEGQIRLFETTYRQLAADARRLATKDDVTRAYGATDWDGLDPAIRELVVDLRFRGDYTPACRRFLQVHIVNNDLDGLARELANRAHWPNVPQDRFDRRRRYCDAAQGRSDAAPEGTERAGTE